MSLFLNSHSANTGRVLITCQAPLEDLEVEMNKTMEGMYHDSPFYQLYVVGWVTSLCISFLIYEMDIIVAPTQGY